MTDTEYKQAKRDMIAQARLKAATPIADNADAKHVRDMNDSEVAQHLKKIGYYRQSLMRLG